MVLRISRVIREGGATVVQELPDHLDYWIHGIQYHQRTLLPLLMTSILVHLLTCATMFVESRWRMVVYLFMFLYFHQHAAKNTVC
jgi:hypothetical protein